MKYNWFYLFVIVSFIAMLFVSSRFFNGSAHSSVGVAHAREYKINADKAAMIKQVNVVPGQQVRKGDLLIELMSGALEIEIEKLTNRIAALTAEQSEKSKLAYSQVAFVKAQDGVELEKFNSEIAETESELRLNNRLTQQFITSGDSSVNEHVALKLNSLKQQRSRQQEMITIKEKEILQRNAVEQKLLSNQILLLEKELALLTEERRALSKHASADGVVGSIYVRPGEQIDAFAALVSVQPLHPTTIIAYENSANGALTVGKEVSVRSYNHPDLTVKGKVIGYGSVAPLPEILQKSTAVKAFGREVFIELRDNNGLATGEKVLVQ